MWSREAALRNLRKARANNVQVNIIASVWFIFLIIYRNYIRECFVVSTHQWQRDIMLAVLAINQKHSDCKLTSTRLC